MPPGLRPLQDQKVGDAAIVPVPQLAQQPRRPAAADDGGNGGVTVGNFGGQRGEILGQSRTADDGVSPRPESGADAVSILGGGDHGVDGDEPCAVGQNLGMADLPVQRPEVGFKGTLGEIRLLKAADGGGEGPHAAAGGYRPGKAVQTDAHAHAPLQDREGEGLSPDRYRHAASVAFKTA